LSSICRYIRRREAAQGLETAAIVVGVDEVVEVGGQLVVAVVVVAFDGRLLDRPVHPLDLAVGPRVLQLGQAMLDVVLIADPVEDVVEGVFVSCLIGELDAPSAACLRLPLRTGLSVSTVWIA
jgi:hypothetical protein